MALIEFLKKVKLEFWQNSITGIRLRNTEQTMILFESSKIIKNKPTNNNNNVSYTGK